MELRGLLPLLLFCAFRLVNSAPGEMIKTNNVFYVMGSDGIYVIDPVAKKLVTKITNKTSPGICTKSNDRYSRNQCNFPHACVVDDFVYVADYPGSAVHVISVHSQNKTETIRTDPYPFGVHFLPWRKEVWVHSWNLSTFDVIETEGHSRTHTAIRAHIKPGWTHGIMVAHKELLEGGSGYVTHFQNPGIHKINLETKSYSDFLNFTRQGCTGTYGVAYNPYNKHLYVDCWIAYPNTSLLEIDVATDKTVKRWNFGGTPFVSPKGRYVVVLSKRGGSRMNVLEVSDAKSEQYPELNITGGVSHAVFYPKGNSSGSCKVFVTLDYSNKMAVVDLDLAKSGDSSAVEYIEDVGMLNSKSHGASRDLFINEKWIISPATASKTVVIINAETQEVHGTVENVNGGGFAVWVGEAPNEQPIGGTSGISNAGMLMSFLIFLLVFVQL